jgi:hypothetical protein
MPSNQNGYTTHATRTAGYSLLTSELIVESFANLLLLSIHECSAIMMAMQHIPVTHFRVDC